MKWKEVELYLKQKDIVLVPVGSTEQHGPAAPLGNDTYVAIGICESIAKRKNIVVTPPIWFAEASHHMGYAGTISVKSEVLIEYLKDVLRSLIKHGFKKIIIVNGNRIANLPAIKIAAKSVKEFEHPAAMIAIIDPAYIGNGGVAFKEADEHHAGEVETSHMLYLYPELIDTASLPHSASKFKNHFSKFSKNCLFEAGPSIDVAFSSKDELDMGRATEGALADASKANTAKGKKFHEYVVDNSCEFIDWLEQTLPKRLAGSETSERCANNEHTKAI